jgi:hypothetical protein
MLTKHPNIVYALPPTRIRRKPKPTAKPARIIVDHSKPPAMTEDDHRRAGEAADRPRNELTEAVAKG